MIPLLNNTSSNQLIYQNHRIWLHVVVWLAFFATPFILPVPAFHQLPAYYLNYIVAAKIIFNLVLIAIFYLNLLILMPQLLVSRNLPRYLGYLALLLAAAILMDHAFLWVFRDDLSEYFVNSRDADPFVQSIRSKRLFDPFHLIANVGLFTLIVLASSLWAVLYDRIREQHFGQQMLYEKTSAELTVLKHQISPHFLFNTLNNIRWLTRKQSDRAEDAIIELSEILRYMLYQTSNNKVELADEITYLSRYVNLQRLRLHEKARVDFECTGNFAGVRIEPLLFIPFVENAFKFGIDPDYPSLISIGLISSGKDIIFTCRNQVFKSLEINQATLTKGIGLSNVRKRLEMYYPKNYTLRIEEFGSSFSVDLKINNLVHE